MRCLLLAALIALSTLPGRLCPARAATHLIWTSDGTTSPLTESCGGTASGQAQIRVVSGLLTGSLSEVRVSDDLGHEYETVDTGPFGDTFAPESTPCGAFPDATVDKSILWMVTCGWHNNSHKITTTIRYMEMVDEYTFVERTATDETSFTFKNLVMTNATSAPHDKYIKWDPATMNEVTLRGTMTAAGTWDQEVSCTIRDPVAHAQIRLMETLVRCPGTASFVWDGKDDSGTLVAKGVYVYEIATPVNSGGQGDSEKSWILTISDVSQQLVSYNTQTQQATVRVRYRLADWDGLPATACEVVAIDATLTERQTVAAPTSAGLHEVDVNVTFDTGDDWLFLVRATDDGSTRHRAHTNHDALPRGEKRTVRQIDLVVDGLPEESAPTPHEEDPGAFIRLNNDYDEGNQNPPGTAVPDNAADHAAGHRIVAGDDDLVNAPIFILPGSGTTGRWSLTFPSNVMVWQDQGGGTFSPVTSGTQSTEITLPHAVSLKVEGVAAGSGLDLVATFTPSGGGNPSSDRVLAAVVAVDLQAEDLFGTVAETQEESPGAYVHANVDNDNGNTSGGDPIADKDEESAVTGEDDLKQVGLAVQSLPLEGTFVLRRTNAKLRVWTSPDKSGAGLLVGNTARTWALDDPAQLADLMAIGSLYVEGYEDGVSNLIAEWKDSTGVVRCSDTVKYTFIAALCGTQPKPDRRTFFAGAFPGLIHCEWSITAPATGVYNCIAWSAGDTSRWYHPQFIDLQFGDQDGVFELSDLDAMYLARKGWTPTATGPGDAQAMYYDGYHAATRKGCGCGAGKWLMFESKCGAIERIEHVWDQLNNGSGYGTPIRFYK